MQKFNWRYIAGMVAVMGLAMHLGAAEPALSPRGADQVIRTVSGVTEGKLDRRYPSVPPKLRDQELRVVQGAGRQPDLLAAQRQATVPPKLLK
jgi:hypothetical protein